MNYNERLMPCPFCGGEANMITIANGSTHHDVSFTFETNARNVERVFRGHMN